MRCEVGAFVMSKRRKTWAMRRGKERGAAPKMSGRLGSPGRRIRKEGNYGQKAAVFCEKVLHFCAKVPLFSTRSAHPSAGGARFCAGSRASFERRASPIFWGICEKGRTCALFCCLLYDEWAASFAEKSAPSAPFRWGMSEKERKVGCSLDRESRVAAPFALTAHREGSRLGSKQPEIVCRVKKRRSRAVLLPR